MHFRSIYQLVMAYYDYAEEKGRHYLQCNLTIMEMSKRSKLSRVTLRKILNEPNNGFYAELGGGWRLIKLVDKETLTEIMAMSTTDTIKWEEWRKLGEHSTADPTDGIDNPKYAKVINEALSGWKLNQGRMKDNKAQLKRYGLGAIKKRIDNEEPIEALRAAISYVLAHVE